MFEFKIIKKTLLVKKLNYELMDPSGGMIGMQNNCVNGDAKYLCYGL